MELCLIQTTKRYFSIKSTQKLFEKLLSHYKDNKITKEELLSKIEKIKDIVKNTCDSLRTHTDLAYKTREKEQLSLLIMEHLEYNGLSKTAKTYAEKNDVQYYGTSVFFKEVKGVEEMFANKEYAKLIELCSFYRVQQKKPFGEIEQKLKVLEYKRICAIDENAAYEFYKKMFCNDKATLNEQFSAFVRDNICENELENQFKEAIYSIYGMSDRLCRRVFYGLVAYKTVFCDKKLSINCPGCVFSEYVKFTNRIENSEIICGGSGIILDSSNQAFCDAGGIVYGFKYLKENNKTIEEPKVCYFI